MTTKYTYSESNITAKVQDGDYLWIAFNGIEGIVTLYKTSMYNNNIVYYNINVTVDRINRMKLKNGNIYCAVDSDDYIGIKIYSLNPLASTAITYINKYSTIIDNSIDLITDTTNLWFLISGNTSGEYASLEKYDYNNILIARIVLNESNKEIKNAKTMDIDNNDNIWIATYTRPLKLVKVYDNGGNYEYSVTVIIE